MLKFLRLGTNPGLKARVLEGRDGVSTQSLSPSGNYLALKGEVSLGSIRSWGFGVFFLFLGAQSSLGGPLPVRDWNEVLGADGIALMDKAGTQIPDALFDLVSNINLSLINTPEFGLSLGLHRNVFNNRELHGSWSVVDRMDLGGVVPFFNSKTNPLGVASNLGFYIGTKDGIELIHIRQVRPEAYAQLPSEEEEKKAIEGDIRYQNFLVNRDAPSESNKTDPRADGRWIYTGNGKGEWFSSFIHGDAGTDVRYSKLWNFVLIPFHLPLKVEALSKLDDGDIISYLGHGSVEMGLSAGWSLDPTGITGLTNAGVSVSTLVRGHYRISVLKENDHLVKVKVTRSRGRGTSSDLGFYYQPTLLDNILILSSLNQIFKVYPFDITTESGSDFFTDVGFRYDLRFEAARNAYESAVIGCFKESDELAFDQDGRWRSDVAETGVIRLFERQSQAVTEYNDNKMSLAFVFHKNNHGAVVETETKLRLPDGTHRLLTSLAQNSKEWALIWNRFEKNIHNFLVKVDLDKAESSEDGRNILQLQMEGRMDNSNTTPAHLLESILDVENSIGKPGLFPRTPEIQDGKAILESEKSWNYFKSIRDLGRSSFCYKVDLASEQVQKFIDVPESEMWPLLEKVFGVPQGSWSTSWKRFSYKACRSPLSLLDLPLGLFCQVNLRGGTDLYHAEKIKEKWIKVKAVKDPKQQAQKLCHLFQDSYYSVEITHLIRSVLNGEEVSYYASGSNQVIGQVTSQGGTQLDKDDLATRITRDVEFDNKAPQPLADNSPMRIDGFSIKTEDPEKMEVHFDLHTKPVKIYLDLASDEWRPFSSRNRMIGAKILENFPEANLNLGLGEGKNTLILDREDQKSGLGELARSIQPGVRYILRMAISEDGKTWSPTVETEFRMPRSVTKPAMAVAG